MLIHKIYQKICSLSELDPEKIAFFEDNLIYTYLDFKNKIECAIFQLKNTGALPNDRIGLFIDNSFDAYCLIYACALSGLTYIPLPTEDPPLRIQTIVALAKISCIICAEKNSKKIISIYDSCVEPSKPKILIFDPVENTKKIHFNFSNDIPLYMLFTSGSTGTPKGVLIHSAGVENFIFWAQSYLAINSNDLFLAHSRLTFDLSVFNLYLPFISGAAVRIVKSKADVIYPGSLLKKDVTIALLVPRVTGLLLESEQLLNDSYPKLRHLLFCGEKLFAAQANAWIRTNKNLTLHNIYGPTETTVTCTFQKLEPSQILNDPIPIGFAIPNMQLNFLSDSNEIINGPTEGELIISGVAVSLVDYCGQSSDRYFNHPLLGRCFKTGDIVKRNYLGQHFWITRIDDQIKIRGFRVELAEIEAVLFSHAGIIDLACVFDPELQSLYIAVSLSDPSMHEKILKQLADLCEKTLPTYMQPNEFVLFKKIPQNINGKADKKKIKELVLEQKLNNKTI
ncbi:MAG: AMP-binding protein [Pseudobdellovibrio sp.]